MKIDLFNGDCLIEMDKLIKEGVRVDAIITDPPYGTTACKWDSIIPFDEMWERLNKLIKPNGAIVLFGSEPFSSALRMSNIKHYKYDWIWLKHQCTNFLNSKHQPLRNVENVCVFCDGKSKYYPIMVKGKKQLKSTGGNSSCYGDFTYKPHYSELYFPKQTLDIPQIRVKNGHPTQKPVKLMEYLIKTYTNENETILDFTAGSFSTGVACVNTNRNFIGIELDKKYFDIGVDRTEKAKQNYQPELF